MQGELPRTVGHGCSYRAMPRRLGGALAAEAADGGATAMSIRVWRFTLRLAMRRSADRRAAASSVPTVEPRRRCSAAKPVELPQHPVLRRLEPRRRCRESLRGRARQHRARRGGRQCFDSRAWSGAALQIWCQFECYCKPPRTSVFVDWLQVVAHGGDLGREGQRLRFKPRIWQAARAHFNPKLVFDHPRL